VIFTLVLFKIYSFECPPVERFYWFPFLRQCLKFALLFVILVFTSLIFLYFSPWLVISFLPKATTLHCPPLQPGFAALVSTSFVLA
jgi:hypothetical protein